MQDKLRTTEEITEAFKTADNRTRYTLKELMAVHQKKSAPDYGWLSTLRAKDIYSQPRSVIDNLCATYEVPRIVLKTDGQVLISQPCLDHILTNSPELLDTTHEQAFDVKIQQVKEQAEAELKAEFKAAYQQKLESL